MVAKRIVWIEDDANIISPVVRPLENAGYEIDRKFTAEEALSKMADLENADVILLDMILPEGRESANKFSYYAGLDVLKAIRKQGIDTPVIVFTVVTADEVLRRIRELGFTEIIRKPVLPSVLKERVEAVLADT